MAKTKILALYLVGYFIIHLAYYFHHNFNIYLYDLLKLVFPTYHKILIEFTNKNFGPGLNVDIIPAISLISVSLVNILFCLFLKLNKYQIFLIILIFVFLTLISRILNSLIVLNHDFKFYYNLVSSLRYFFMYNPVLPLVFIFFNKNNQFKSN